MKLKFVFYTDNVSVEGEGVLRGEWMVEGEEGKYHRKQKPQLSNEVVKVTGGHFVVGKLRMSGRDVSPRSHVNVLPGSF